MVVHERLAQQRSDRERVAVRVDRTDRDAFRWIRHDHASVRSVEVDRHLQLVPREGEAAALERRATSAASAREAALWLARWTTRRTKSCGCCSWS